MPDLGAARVRAHAPLDRAQQRELLPGADGSCYVDGQASGASIMAQATLALGGTSVQIVFQ